MASDITTEQEGILAKISSWFDSAWSSTFGKGRGRRRNAYDSAVRQLRDQYNGTSNETIFNLYSKMELGENYTVSEEVFTDWVLNIADINTTDLTDENLG